MPLVRLFVLTLMLSLPEAIRAHGGGVNSEGCHTQKSTGEYHCHSAVILAPKFNRQDFGFDSYKPSTTTGFYTQTVCEEIHIDHVVSLKDAFESGARNWSKERKVEFANDRENHRPACSFVNMSKSASSPSGFLRKSSDGKGLDYEIVTFCEYLGIYFYIKEKYDLSTNQNDLGLSLMCD